MNQPTLIWHRLDLRLSDNPALHAAAARGGSIVPVFIWEPDEEAPWRPGGASKWWLHQSLKSLARAYEAVGSRLIIRFGPSLSTLQSLARETGAVGVFWNRRYEPAIIDRDAKIKHALKEDSLDVQTFNAALLHEPWTVQNKSGKPFQVFTPFWKHCLSLPEPAAPLPAPSRLTPPAKWPHSLDLQELELEPKIDWAGTIRAAWRTGEAAALGRVEEFLRTGFGEYSQARNRPDVEGTSRLSPYLHFGELSPRQVWHYARSGGITAAQWRSSQFLSELGWREFAHHLLYHFPKTPEEPLRSEFAEFRWRTEPVWLRSWQKGLTGYPIVDAGMRELWATGWMHNRVRMIVGSFLVKDLLISWRHGAAWFWDALVDADLAQNTLGWQWIAGCGADAAPFFRVFNPVLQGEKFDPHGTYVRRWCPELSGLANRWIHQPWAAPPDLLKYAGVELGGNYPKRIVSHTIAREVALEEYSRCRKTDGDSHRS